MSSQPINLVSVNTVPERAKKVIGQVIDNVKDRYAIVHAGNSESELGCTPYSLLPDISDRGCEATAAVCPASSRHTGKSTVKTEGLLTSFQFCASMVRLGSGGS
jgi:hypothetical protein